MIFLGFSAGLPYLLVFSTLSAWLRDEGVSHQTIGFFSWVGVMYSIKVFWAPFIDNLDVPLLGKWLGYRRAWMLLAQLTIAIGLTGMSLIDVHSDLSMVALFALLVAFGSATQDISVDAYRIEAVEDRYQGAMAATYVFGYRVALLVAGAGAFYLAEFQTWAFAYQIMALLMLVGLLTTLIIREPAHTQPQIESAHRHRNLSGAVKLLHWFRKAMVEPFIEFFHRNGRQALLILALIGVYKLSDITMGVMANPFYLDLGFTKPEIANVTKIFGFFMTIFGAGMGGLLVARYGIRKPLFLGAVLVASTNLLFALLAVVDTPDLKLLALVVSADNLSGGVATAVFIAWLSSLTNRAYTATQYALFSSLMTLPAKVIGGFSGIVVDAEGYPLFFTYAAVLGLPAILLVLKLLRQADVKHPATNVQGPQ